MSGFCLGLLLLLIWDLLYLCSSVKHLDSCGLDEVFGNYDSLKAFAFAVAGATEAPKQEKQLEKHRTRLELRKLNNSIC